MQIADLFYSIRGEGFDQLESKINKTSKKLAGVGTAFTAGVTTPILAMGAGIVNTTMTFDQEMSKVKAVTGETGKGFDTLRDLALDMGSKTSKSATEAAEAISYMGLAGWDLTQIQEGLEPVLRASEAGFMDLGTTSDLVTDSMSALGIGTEDLGRYLDIAAKAQNTSNQSMEQFLNAMVTAGGTFKMFNIPLEESGALLGILANRGFKGSEAGNALTSIFANLTSGTGQAGKAMKELGIEVYDSNGKFRGATTILKEMNEKFDGMTEAQRNTYIQMIGGKTRTKELTALLNGTSEELDDLTDGLYNSDGALSDMAATMKDNFAGQITSIKSKLEGIAISIGDRLTPYLKIAAEWIQKLADWFYKLPGPVKDVIIVVGLIAAAIGPLLLLFAGVVSAIGFVASAFSTVAAVIGSIGAPVAIAVVAIVGIVTALGALLLSSEEVRNGIKEKFQDIWNKIKEVGGWIKDHIEDIKQAFKGLFQGLTTGDFSTFKEAMKNMVPPEAMEKINTIVEKIKDFREKVIEIRDKIIEFAGKINEALEPVKQMFMDTFSSFDTTAIVDAFNQVKETMGPVIELFKMLGMIVGGVVAVAIGIVIGLWNGIVKAIDNVIAAVLNIVGIFTSVLGIVVGIVTGNTDMIKESFSNLVDNIIGFFVNLGIAVWDLVSGFVEGIITWFTSLYDTLVGHSIIPDLINSIIDWFKSLPGKVIAFVMDLVSRAIAKFTELKNAVVNKVKELITNAVNTFKAIVSKIGSIIDNLKSSAKAKFDAIKSTLSTIVNNIKTTLQDKFKAAKDKVLEIFDTLKSKISDKFEAIKGFIQPVIDKFNGIKDAVSGVIDKIAGIKFPSVPDWVPGFAGGVRNFAGGWAMVGEQGPELMYVPKGSDIYSNSQSKNMLNNATPSKMITSANNQESVNLYGDIVIDAKSVEEFNDIVSLLKGVKHYKNMR